MPAPVQHGCPSAPQAWQVSPPVPPPAHVVPAALHLRPAQQASPAPPQTTQLVPLQAVPAAVQASPAQQTCPDPPQGAQVPFEHATALAVQLSARPPVWVQQGCPLPPQVPQEPLAQVPPTEHSVPLATQVLFTQQPLPHELALQHASPGPPQATQVPAPPPPPEQTVDGPLQIRPVQQASPAPPQATVDVLVDVVVTVNVTVPVCVPVPDEVTVLVLVAVEVTVRPPLLLEQLASATVARIAPKGLRDSDVPLPIRIVFLLEFWK